MVRINLGSLSFVFLNFCFLSSGNKCFSTNLQNVTIHSEHAAKHNISYKIHCITTKDGYHLSLFHVYDNTANDVASRQPVLIQHGLGANALEFTIEINDMISMAYYLVKNGFNVWVGNARGSLFSQSHNYLRISDRKFWNFSFHEMGVIDVPSMLESIYEKTSKQNKIIYIGHSMGTNLLGVYASSLKDHAKKFLKRAVLISPVILMKHTKVKLLKVPQLFEFIFAKLQAFGFHSLFSEKSLEKRLLRELCVFRDNFDFCGALLQIANGKPSKPPKDFVKELLMTWPDQVSIKTLRHFLQTIISRGKAPMYNYGPRYNKILYNSAVVPKYDIEGIQVPCHIFYGEQDVLAPKEDAELLYSTLTSEKTIQGVSNFNHIDFIIGKDVVQKFFIYLVKILNK